MVDGSFLDRRSDIKNMHDISVAVDSLIQHGDSVGRAMYNESMRTTFYRQEMTPADSTRMAEEHIRVINTDSIYNSMTSAEKLKTLNYAQSKFTSLNSEWNMKSYMTKDTDDDIRSHRSDWNKKNHLVAGLSYILLHRGTTGSHHP